MNLTKELEVAKKLALAAGKEIMQHYHAETIKVEIKEDNTPVTAADIAANEIIVNGLREHFCDDAILSEEEKDDLSRLSKQRVWIIDPIDGTKHFVNRTGEFTVNIGLVSDGKPILGVIFAPAFDELYFAAQGIGAFLGKNGKSSPIAVSSKQDRSEFILLKGSRHNTSFLGYTDQMNFLDHKEIGSSLKGCHIADARAEIYLRFTTLAEWDICAMHAIVENAGGKMTALDGSNLHYNKEHPHMTAGFIATNDTIHAELLPR